MLKLVISSYKTLCRNFHFIICFAIPVLALSAINIYLRTSLEATKSVVYLTYTTLILLPFVNAATDISIYRKLFKFNIINPLSSIQAYVRYLLGQTFFGLIGTAPVFLLYFIFLKTGLSPMISLILAVIANIFIGFAFMARFYIVLPLIIQNKIPSLKEFLLYTKRPYLQWVSVATLIYLPYVVIHYLTLECPYTNLFLTTIATYLFICFNVNYVNNNRLSRITYKSTTETPIVETIMVTKVEKKVEKKAEKAPKKTNKASPKKTSGKKVSSPKAAGKKTTKRPTPKLKPALA